MPVHDTLTCKVEGESRELEIKGQVAWKNATVKLGGEPVAEIHRDVAGREAADRQTVSQ